MPVGQSWPILVQLFNLSLIGWSQGGLKLFITKMVQKFPERRSRAEVEEGGNFLRKGFSWALVPGSVYCRIFTRKKQIQYYQLERRCGYCDAHCVLKKVSVYLTSPNDYSGEGSGNPVQYSCLENPMEGGDLWAAVHGVAKSRTRLSNFTFPFYFHALEKEMATHSSVLAWRIPGTGEPGGLPSMGSHRVGHD